MEHLRKVKEKILSAPHEPGVYLFSDAAGKVLYVGKAKILNKRLRSYLRAELDAKTRAFMLKVRDLEIRLAPSEDMALLMEAGLIRELKPQYNVSLRDDKSFPYIQISGEEFPAISITRKKEDAAALYLGPFTSARLLKSALKIIRRHFPFRTCKHLPGRSCIDYKINLCPAPCIGAVSRQEYSRRMQNIILILEGKIDVLVRDLTRLMQEKSQARDYESAAGVRDQIMALSAISEGQSHAGSQRELEDLGQKIKLEHLPIRIEGFDISNISGNQAVGSMVSFYNGRPDKNNYRRFRIKTFQGVNDYKMLAEVLHRRYLRLKQEQKPLPDLVLIDGGKGHLLTAFRKLAELQLDIPLVSIAKPRKMTSARSTRGRKEEHIYCSRQQAALTFPEGSLALNLIRRVRDEAHRFALAYHHLLRKKALIKQ